MRGCRIFNDAPGLAAGRNLRSYLIQSDARFGARDRSPRRTCGATKATVAVAVAAGAFRRVAPRNDDRSKSESSLRKQGPIRRGLAFWHRGERLLRQLTPVVMGPCFRRDDNVVASLIEISNSQNKTSVGDLAARCARTVHEICPSRNRGCRECRVPAAPAASCAK